MRINSGIIGMESARTYSQSEGMSKTYSQDVTNNFSEGTFLNTLLSDQPMNQEDLPKEQPREDESINDDPVSALSEIRNRMLDRMNRIGTDRYSLAEEINRMREECINMLLRLLFPDRELKTKDIAPMSEEDCDYSDTYGNDALGNTKGMMIQSRTSYFYEESESTFFSAVGHVNCADGKTVDINIDVSMSRSFSMEYAEELEYFEVALTDPLVINFNGASTDLTDQTFYFDIDSDGIEDEISNLIDGCGFLALDINDDGIINDGSELFGTKSGDGFYDLAEYDSDNDGFLDEDDEIFDKLRIMCVDENGNQQLYSLKEKDVGAIYLKSAGTRFSLNDPTTNAMRGQIQSTGIYLHEDGSTGLAFQMDLAKRAKAKAAYA